MTEPTIVCPNCKSEIKLTESLAAPLIEATKRSFEQRLAQKDLEVGRRESALREREEALAKAKDSLDDQVAEKLKQERAKIAADEARKARQALATDLVEKRGLPRPPHSHDRRRLAGERHGPANPSRRALGNRPREGIGQLLDQPRAVRRTI